MCVPTCLPACLPATHRAWVSRCTTLLCGNHWTSCATHRAWPCHETRYGLDTLSRPVCMLCCCNPLGSALHVSLSVHHQPTLSCHTHIAWRPQLCRAAPQTPSLCCRPSNNPTHTHTRPSCRSLCPRWASCHSCVSCGLVGKPSWRSASTQQQTKSGTGLCQQTGVCAGVRWDSDGCSGVGHLYGSGCFWGVDADGFGVCWVWMQAVQSLVGHCAVCLEVTAHGAAHDVAHNMWATIRFPTSCCLWCCQHAGGTTWLS